METAKPRSEEVGRGNSWRGLVCYLWITWVVYVDSRGLVTWVLLGLCRRLFAAGGSEERRCQTLCRAVARLYEERRWD